MKKIFTIAMALSALGLIIAGCSGGEKAAEGGEAAPAAEGSTESK